MKKYLIRFNTLHNGSPLVWRIIDVEQGVEHLGSDVKIRGDVFTECSLEHGQTKWNIACIGRLTWIDTCACIDAQSAAVNSSPSYTNTRPIVLDAVPSVE